MAEKIRFRCPLCGGLADEEILDNPSPFVIKVFLMKFGGKVAGHTKGRGSAKGYKEYVDVTKEYPDLVKAVKDKLRIIAK